MKLASMEIENFRCFEKLHIDFDERLTVLVGANGSGKTAIIEGITLFFEEYIYRFIHFNAYFRKSADYIRFGQKQAKLQFSHYGIGKLLSSPLEITLVEGEPVSDKEKKYNLLPKVVPIVVQYCSIRTLDKIDRIFDKTGESTEKRDSLKDAFANGFTPFIAFSNSLTWFIQRSSEEALEAVRLKDLNYKLTDLSAVKAAISQALGDYNEPYVAKTPPDLFITHKSAPDTPLTVRQLSDGYRTMLALVMDLARRMAVANAEVEWPEGQSVLHSPGIVLIDEVEQHLHPAWQQTVLPRLLEIFPNVQFIVTTHSPQVLTSIKAKHIRVLRDGKMYTFPEETDGAEAGRVLEDVLGVHPRPQENATARKLREYERLVNDGQWDTPEAMRLKKELDAHYGDAEPKLDELALRIETMKWERGL